MPDGGAAPAPFDPVAVLRRVDAILREPFFTKNGLLMRHEAARAHVSGALAYHDEVTRLRDDAAVFDDGADDGT